jgi:hypothetical protein
MTLPYVSIPLNVNVQGALTSTGGLTIPSGSVTDDAVKAAAGVQASKLQQRPPRKVNLSDHATAVAASRRQIHYVYGATASILAFGVVASVAAGSASSATVDLKKNGTTILTGTITLDNGTAAFVLKQGVLASADLVQGDVLEADVTAVAGANVPKGVTAYLWLNEDPQ